MEIMNLEEMTRGKVFSKHHTSRKKLFQSQETLSAQEGSRFEGVNNFEYEVENFACWYNWAHSWKRSN